jgi:hypothetical protein
MNGSSFLTAPVQGPAFCGVYRNGCLEQIPDICPVACAVALSAGPGNDGVQCRIYLLYCLTVLSSDFLTKSELAAFSPGGTCAFSGDSLDCFAATPAI